MRTSVCAVEHWQLSDYLVGETTLGICDGLSRG
jgi:hypothetical protein